MSLMNDKCSYFIKNVVPTLTPQLYKGLMGKVGVVGGSKEYTGAPYFCGISTMLSGCDLCHVFCPDRDASIVLKGYSPDLIVHNIVHSKFAHPLEPTVDKQLDVWFNRLDSVVIGPGLGRDESMLHIIETTLRLASDYDIPVVIDADALHFITKKPELIKQYRSYNNTIILTPNTIEMKRLSKRLGVGTGNDDVIFDTLNKKQKKEYFKSVSAAMSNWFGDRNVWFLYKEFEDVVFKSASETIEFSDYGKNSTCLRRVGGQGDILSGIVATYMAWCKKTNMLACEEAVESALLCASWIGKNASSLTYSKFGRSMLASDIIKSNVLNESLNELTLMVKHE